MVIVMACGGPTSGGSKPADSGTRGDGTTTSTASTGTTPPGGTTASGTPATTTTTADTAGPLPPNVLLVVADDLGVDFLSVYGADGGPVPRTPTLDSLAEGGVRFEHAWSEPLCSPTRAELLTGRYARTWDLGTAVRYADALDLPPEAVTLPEILGPRWSTAFVGKWHLSSGDPGLTAPLVQGFAAWSGALGNIGPESSPTGMDGQTYDRWEKVSDGVLERSTTYATTDTVNDALRHVTSLPEPWLVEVAFNAGHSPYHFPDPALLNQDWSEAPRTSSYRFGSMIEALDTELARLLAAVDRDRTVVIFVGDNGTPGGVVPEPAKGTVYEAGVRVPFLARGPGITPGLVIDAPVNLVDVPATVLDLAGVTTSEPLDGVSLTPCFVDAACRPRETAFAYAFTPNGPGPYNSWTAAVRDERYKLIEGYHAVLQPEVEYTLHDMQGEGEAVDLLAGEPLPDVLAIRDRLLEKLDGYLER